MAQTIVVDRTFREDTYRIGDRVERNPEADKLTSHDEFFAYGPIKVLAVYYPHNPRRNAVGHTQWLDVENALGNRLLSISGHFLLPIKR